MSDTKQEEKGSPENSSAKECMATFDAKQPMATFSQLFGLKGKSGFGSGSTAKQVATKFADRLKGKTVIVTGPTIGGIGYEAALRMAEVGATVVLAGRSKAKGEAAVAAIREEVKDAQVSWIALDTADLATVRAFVGTFTSEHEKLHVLLNNAGIMATHFSKTKYGFESQFGVCHLGHFLLTELLMPTLEKTCESKEDWARVVNVSSFGHNLQKGVDKATLFDAGFMNDEANYKPWPSYGRAKIANVIHAKWLAQRFEAKGLKNLKAFSLMPGAIDTNLGNHLDIPALMKLLMKMTSKSIPQGAATSVWAAAAPELDEGGGIPNGAYLEDCNLQPFEHPFASDPAVMQQLVDTSYKAVDLTAEQ